MFRTKLAFFDFCVVLFVLLLAGVLFWHPWQVRERGETLVITTSTESTEYTLSKDRRIELSSNGIALCVVIENGSAYVLHSECDDGVCVASGAVSKVGEGILCAPAGVSIRVKGGSGDVDFVAG